MAILYKPSPHDTKFEGESLTEPEHKDSCDINKMIKNILRGVEVRGANVGSYGYDDTTMDGVQFRIQKQKLEEELSQTAQTHEFSEEELKAIPDEVKKKFNFKTKKAVKKAEAKNDDQTTNQPPASKTAQPVEDGKPSSNPS